MIQQKWGSTLNHNPLFSFPDLRVSYKYPSHDHGSTFIEIETKKHQQLLTPILTLREGNLLVIFRIFFIRPFIELLFCEGYVARQKSLEISLKNQKSRTLEQKSLWKMRKLVRQILKWFTPRFFAVFYLTISFFGQLPLAVCGEN